MVTPFDPRTVEHDTVRFVLDQHLALEDAAIFQREMKHVSMGRRRHRIKPYHRRRIVQALQHITHTSQAAMTTMQTPDTLKRLPLRHLLHTFNT